MLINTVVTHYLKFGSPGTLRLVFQVQVAYLGSDPRKNQSGSEEVRQEKEDNMMDLGNNLGNWVITTQSHWKPLGENVK